MSSIFPWQPKPSSPHPLICTPCQQLPVTSSPRGHRSRSWSEPQRSAIAMLGSNSNGSEGHLARLVQKQIFLGRDFLQESEPLHVAPSSNPVLHTMASRGTWCWWPSPSSKPYAQPSCSKSQDQPCSLFYFTINIYTALYMGICILCSWFCWEKKGKKKKRSEEMLPASMSWENMWKCKPAVGSRHSGSCNGKKASMVYQQNM